MYSLGYRGGLVYEIQMNFLWKYKRFLVLLSSSKVVLVIINDVDFFLTYYFSVILLQEMCVREENCESSVDFK